MTTLPNILPCKSVIKTSVAKATPAIGALNVAAIPAAAPHETRFFIRLSERLNNCPNEEPRAEPTWTIGPSLPADPPVPIQSAEAIILAIATLGLFYHHE